MKKSYVSIPSNDGKNTLNVVIWETKEKPIGILQLVHGMAEYIERYDDFANYLTESGFEVIGHDHLGHGKTAKSREDLGYFAEKNGDNILIDDIYNVTKYATEKWPGLPNYILGHSMGSFCVREYLTKYSENVSGAIIMGTGWISEIVSNIGKFVAKKECKKHGDRYISKKLVKMSLGNYNKSFEPARTSVDWLSRDFEQVNKYIEDPLCGFDFTAGAYKDFFSILVKIAKNKNLVGIKKNLPIFIVSGEKDPVGGKKACENLVEQYYCNGLSNSSLHIFKYDRHEILNEIDRKMVYFIIKSWLVKKIDEIEVIQKMNSIYNN